MNGSRVPERIHRAGATVIVTWDAHHQSVYPARRLRLACHCATCREEITDEPLLEPDSVPETITADAITLVGTYGIRIRWSDGHDTGIYTYEHLYALCPCDRCAAERGHHRATG